MAINEKIVTGRKFRRLIDKEAKLWLRFSLWSKADDVEFDDGKTAEQKVGNINGITDDVYNNRSDISQSSAGVFTIRNALDHGIINNRIQFVIDEDGNLGWKRDGADAVINFSSIKGFRDKLKSFSKIGTVGNDCIYYLGGNCIPVMVFTAAHSSNGVTYYGEWNIFRGNAQGPTVSVTPISSYTTKVNKNNITVVDKTVVATSGTDIVGWKLVGKCLDKDSDTTSKGGFYCYYIDGQSNLKYDDLYNHAPVIEENSSPYPLV